MFRYFVVAAILMSPLQANSQTGTASGMSVKATGGTTSQTMADIASRVVYPEQFGAGCTTATDSTTAMQAALNTGRMVKLKSDCVYKITTRLVLPINPSTGNTVGIEGPGKLYFPAASFTNTSLSDKTGATAVFIAATGDATTPWTNRSYNIAFRNFTIQSEVSQGRVLRAIRLYNATNVEVSGVEIYGLPIGYGITANTINDLRIKGNYIHDFLDNTTWAAIPQSTAIEVDEDRANGVSSRGVVISGNTIERIQHGSTISGTWNYQTDGINVQMSDHAVVSNNTIIDASEGIDFFGDYGVISGNTVYGAKAWGIKLIHGASYNVVIGNVVRSAGYAGIVLSGTNAAAIGHNVVANNVVIDVNPNNDPLASAIETSAILVDGAGFTYVPTNNTFLGNTLLPGTYGKWAFRDSGGVKNTFLQGLSVAGVSGLFSAGTATIQSPLTYVTATKQSAPGDLAVAGTTASTGSASGALTVAGGVGIVGDVYTQGIVRAGGTTASTSTTTGALISAGGLGVAGAGFLGGNLSVGTTTNSAAINIGGDSKSVLYTGTGTHRTNLTSAATYAVRINGVDLFTLTGSSLNIAAASLADTPGSKQPLCYDSANGNVYKGVAGAC